MRISVIITALNEGTEVQATIDSIRANTSDCEIVLVDDGSTDGSCIKATCDQLVTHPVQIGIAQSRLDGVAVARGDCFAFLDAHQRLSEGCLNLCADLAIERQCIVWPDVCGLGPSRWMGHGAALISKEGKKAGLFDGNWIRTKPSEPISRCTTMIVPGYVIPRSVWPKVCLPNGLRIHGASEPAVSVKAFFADVDILHLCGPLARHRFTAGHRLPFPCPWHIAARNHAIVARTCFSERTWQEYWAPRVFRRHLKEEGLKELDLPQFTAQQQAFESYKKRSDEEYWRGLLLTSSPLNHHGV